MFVNWNEAEIKYKYYMKNLKLEMLPRQLTEIK